MLAQAALDSLAVQLEQSPFLQIVSDQRVQRTLQLMGRMPTERLTGPVAREVCERIGATVLLEGSISNLGNAYVLGLRATRCGSGDLLDIQQTTASTKEQVQRCWETYIRPTFEAKRCSGLAGYRRESQNSKELWIILESGSLIRLVRSRT